MVIIDFEFGHLSCVLEQKQNFEKRVIKTSYVDRNCIFNNSVIPDGSGLSIWGCTQKLSLVMS